MSASTHPAPPAERSRRPNGTFALEPADRFWSRVDVGAPNACWEWQGARDSFGYGQAREATHRTAWALTHGPIPSGMCVCHRCDNPPCCNPDHLFLGTRADNNRDRHAKGRSANLERGERHPQAGLTAAKVSEDQVAERVRPANEALLSSALELLTRMIEVGRDEKAGSRAA